MAVLDILKKIKIETMTFENHPCNTMDLETKIHYINGLMLVTNEDDNIDDKEIEYINILINSFNLTNENLDEALEFAKNPDKNTILDMLEILKLQDIKYSFILDCMVLSIVDEDYNENEKLLIKQYEEMLSLPKQEIIDINNIFEKLKSKDAQGLDMIFKSSTVKKELIEYLFNFYEIDMSYGLSEEEKKILNFEFITPTFERGGLQNATEIMKDPITKEQYCVFLNNMYSKEKIKIDSNGNIVDNNNNIIINRSAEYINKIVFYNKKFIVDDTDKILRVVNVTALGAEMFIEWINSNFDTNYKLSEFYGDLDYSNFTFTTEGLCNMRFEFLKYNGNYYIIDENELEHESYIDFKISNFKLILDSTKQIFWHSISNINKIDLTSYENTLFEKHKEVQNKIGLNINIFSPLTSFRLMQ